MSCRSDDALSMRAERGRLLLLPHDEPAAAISHLHWLLWEVQAPDVFSRNLSGKAVITWRACRIYRRRSPRRIGAASEPETLPWWCGIFDLTTISAETSKDLCAFGGSSIRNKYYGTSFYLSHLASISYLQAFYIHDNTARYRLKAHRDSNHKTYSRR